MISIKIILKQLILAIKKYENEIINSGRIIVIMGFLIFHRLNLRLQTHKIKL